MKISSILKKDITLWVSQSYKNGIHEALDFALSTIKAKTPLVAVTNGIVGREYPKGFSHLAKQGFTLKHRSGAFFLYQHCQPTVSVGSLVKRGQVIGYVDTAVNQRKLKHNMKDGNEHCHFEVHPTGVWDVRDQPLAYFDRNEVKYNRQSACTSTPLNYQGIPDKHLEGGNIMYELEKRDNNLWIVNINSDHHGTLFVSKNGKSFTKYDGFDKNKGDRMIVKDMDEAIYMVDWAYKKKFFVNGDPLANLEKANEVLEKRCIEYEKSSQECPKKLEKLKVDIDDLKKENKRLEKNFVGKVQSEVTKVTKSLTKKLNNCRKELKEAQKEPKDFNLAEYIYEKIKGVFSKVPGFGE